MAKLRRPGWVDWALVRVADDDADVVARFAADAAAMRSAQEAVGAGRTADVAPRLRAVRDSAAVLAKAADAALRQAGRSSELPAVLERLSAVAGDPAASAALRAGLLHPDVTRELVPGLEVDPEPDPAPDVDEPDAQPLPAPPRARRKPTRRHEPPSRRVEPSEPAPAAPSRREVEQARSALRLAEQAAARAERRAAEAEHAQVNAERTAAKAAAALSEATEHAAQAQRRLADARAAVADATAALEALADR